MDDDFTTDDITALRRGRELPAFLCSRISRPCRTRSGRGTHRTPGHRSGARPSPTATTGHRPAASTPRICDCPRCRDLADHTETSTCGCALCAWCRDAAARRPRQTAHRAQAYGRKQARPAPPGSPQPRPLSLLLTPATVCLLGLTRRQDGGCGHTPCRALRGALLEPVSTRAPISAARPVNGEADSARCGACPGSSSPISS